MRRAAMADLSVVIVSYNVRPLLADCLRSVIDECRGLAAELIVVDNGSGDGSAAAVRREFPGVTMVANAANAGFAKACNQGAAIATAPYLLLLNPDTVVRPGAIRCVREFMERTPDAGLAACRLLGADGRPQASIGYFPTIGRMLLQALLIDRWVLAGCRRAHDDTGAARPVDYLSGAFMMVRRDAVPGPELLRESYFMYAEEKDLARRLPPAGYRCYYVPCGDVVHLGGKSTEAKPLDNFLELHRSQVIYFCLHHPGAERAALIFLYGLFLATTTLASAFTVFSRHGRQRFALFLVSAVRYPLLAARACRSVTVP
ncbi:glycosyltransferase family 2 protein, partial [bacterium]|nr:glycosyltransferase family 2 protein [bacterium]